MYKDLKKIYDKNELDIFSMAITYIVDKGFTNVEKITEEEIQSVKGNGLMTSDFCQDLIRLAKEIVQAAKSPTEIIQFCQAVDLFDRKQYCNKPNYNTLENIVYNVFSLIKERCFPLYDGYWKETCDELGCDPEDLLSIGVINEKELDEQYEDIYEDVQTK